MKYYIIVDDQEIVRSTDTSMVDPVATEKKACEELFRTDQYRDSVDQINKLKKILETTKKGSDQYRRTESMIVDTNKHIKAIFSEHVKKNSVYMSIAPGDGLTAIEVSESAFNECNGLITNNDGGFVVFSNSEFLTTGDSRGKYFYQDENDEWQSYVCIDPMEEIPEEWILVGALTPEQKAEIRSQLETPEQRSDRLYNEKFREFLNRIFLESPEYRDLDRG